MSVASESGVNIPAETVHYGVTKAAQRALLRGLAETTAGTGVTVSTMLAGPTASEGIGQFVAGPARPQGKPKAGVEAGPLTHARPPSLPRRFPTPEEVASLVGYVCSPLVSATNGAALHVDRGLVLNGMRDPACSRRPNAGGMPQRTLFGLRRRSWHERRRRGKSISTGGCGPSAGATSLPTGMGVPETAESD